MKKLILLCFVWQAAWCATAQPHEFEVYDNGLIYSEQTMDQLTHIVDSLNLSYQSCDLNQTYYSKQQTVGHLIHLDEGKVKAALKDMEAGIPLDEFLKKYPQAEVQRGVLILRHQYVNSKAEEVVAVNHFDLQSDYGFRIVSHDASLYEKDVQDTWLPKYYKKTSYSEESVTAFYFPTNFSSTPIPHQYAMMIGYADCLIDTTSGKMHENAEYGSYKRLPARWRNLSDRRQLALLEDMRNTRVVGSCSQDSSPRYHAFNMALLSAETAQWDVFLKAHLDIMNDRFERVTDGSYAWGQRNTYIGELEQLNIQVLDLLIGISFRLENPAQNHYFGSIGRLGRALAETQDRADIEAAMLSIVSDPELDDYNRMLFYFLFLNYNYHLDGEQDQQENQQRLDEAVATLPAYLQEGLAKN
ncbi:MAG TPA: hypothetical protein DCE41_33545 [Cytophagales bacterium]|nr:hypothetical protein [Cytophagales bacterium]HAA17349.1 hypothetical protein [Cytophagales bacterium]HAP59940.1 hypothetical protein [Cytophagales bacterium]